MSSLFVNNQELHFFTSPYIGENMYLLIKGDKALIIDPNGSEESLTLLKQHKVQDITIFLTHEHPDHTCGVPFLKKNFKTTLVCQQKCAQQIAERRNNRPILVAFVLAVQDEKNGTHTEQEFINGFEEYECLTDITFEQDLIYDWQGEHFVFHYTPGHSQGSCCIVWNNKAVFTGDSLLKDMPVITRFPGGNTKQYNEITKPYLGSLADNILALPGHGKTFLMKELRESAA